MHAENALVDYLISGITDAIQKWREDKDVYGLWLEVILGEDDPKQAFLKHAWVLRARVTPKKEADKHRSEWAATLGETEVLNLCEDGWSADGEEFPEYPGDPIGKQLRDDFFQQKRLQESGDELTWFLDICGKVILRLHTEEVLIQLWGKPIPVGVVIGNDMPHTLTLSVTRDSNPDRISRGMEEWLMGRTYAQIAAEGELLTELRAWPIDNQAHFWRNAMWGQMLWARAIGTTPEWEEVRGLGISGPDWHGPALALLVDLIVKDAEASLSVELPTSPERQVIEFLLMELFSLEHSPELQAQVQEETITRLYALLRRLYEESQQHERIGSALQLTARALHALRPSRFPAVRFTGHKANPNRLVEPERFGLE